MWLIQKSKSKLTLLFLGIYSSINHFPVSTVANLLKLSSKISSPLHTLLPPFIVVFVSPHASLSGGRSSENFRKYCNHHIFYSILCGNIILLSILST